MIKKRKLSLLFSALLVLIGFVMTTVVVQAANSGIGITNPQTKLHVSQGTIKGVFEGLFSAKDSYRGAIVYDDFDDYSGTVAGTAGWSEAGTTNYWSWSGGRLYSASPNGDWSNYVTSPYNITVSDYVIEIDILEPGDCCETYRLYFGDGYNVWYGYNDFILYDKAGAGDGGGDNAPTESGYRHIRIEVSPDAIIAMLWSESGDNIVVQDLDPAYATTGLIGFNTENSGYFDNLRVYAGSTISTSALPQVFDLTEYTHTSKIGIGTAAPATTLDVNGDITADTFSGTFSGTYSGSINASNVSAGTFGSGTGNGNFIFPSYAGIGVTPSYRLDVLGSASDDVVARFKATGSGTSDYAEVHILNNADNALIIGSIGSNYSPVDWAGSTYVYNTGSGRDMYIKSQDRIDLFTGGTALDNRRLSILSDGSVGIGTTAPATRLTIESPSTFSAEVQRWQYNSNPANFYLNLEQKVTSGEVRWVFDLVNNNVLYENLLTLKSGKVGISTSDPTVPLDVIGSARITGNLNMDSGDITSVNKLSFAEGTNFRIEANTSGLIFDGGDGTADFLVYDNQIYSDTLRLGYSGAANIITHDTNENLTIDPNGSGRVNITGDLSVSGAISGTISGVNLSSTDVFKKGDAAGADANAYDQNNKMESIYVHANYTQSNFPGSYGQFINFGTGASDLQFFTSSSQNSLQFRSKWWTQTWSGWNTIIHSGNIGSQSVNYATTAGSATTATSATNADTVDSLHAASFIRADADDNVTGNTEWQDNYSARFGNGADFRIWHNGTDTYFRSYLHGARYLLQGENAAGSNKALIYADPDNSVFLYYTGLEKFKTTSTGAEINGCLNTGPGCNELYAMDQNVRMSDDVVFGDIYGTAFIYYSDKKLKKDIKPLEGSLDKIMSLEGISFKWKDSETGTKTNIGLIAQDVERVVPELVVTNPQDGLKAVEYGNVVALLIEAVKEQQKQINELREIVNSTYSPIEEKIDINVNSTKKEISDYLDGYIFDYSSWRE